MSLKSEEDRKAFPGTKTDKPGTPQLNSIQTYVLGSLSDGRTISEISVAMELSQLTICAIIESAVERLNAKSVPHAVQLFKR